MIFARFRFLPAIFLMGLAQCGGKLEGPEPEPIEDEVPRLITGPPQALQPEKVAGLPVAPKAPEQPVLCPCVPPGPPPPPIPPPPPAPPVPDDRPPMAPIPGGQLSCGAGKCG